MWHDVSCRALVLLGCVISFVTSSSAEEITLTLKGGGGFKIVGELKAYDGKKYTIINPSFGRMMVDSRRFDCVSDNCPTGPIKAELSPRSIFGSNKSEFMIAGSNAIGAQLMPGLIRAYAGKMKLNVTDVPLADPLDLIVNISDSRGCELAAITLRKNGSGPSFRTLESKAAVIGMASRRINSGEAARLNAAGLGNMRGAKSEHLVGLDGLVILTAPENPAISISIQDVGRVFSGQVTDWAELGYPAGPINVYAPVANSDTWDAFNSLVLRPKGLKLVGSANRTSDYAEQSDLVAADPLGIGVVALSYQRNAKALNVESSCGLITPPSKFSIKTEEYPLSRRLYLYTSGQPKLPLAAGLLEFALSAEAQPTIEEAGFVDRAAELISFRKQGSRVAYALNAPKVDFDLGLMRTFLTDLKGADRLTYTFRFRTASNVLDNQSKQYVDLLSNLMTSSILRNKSIKLVGFADSGGAFQTNLSLSLSRAEAVRSAIVAAGKGKIEPSRLLVRGYGELAPVACNDTSKGKAFNRRVEVWVDRDQ